MANKKMIDAFHATTSPIKSDKTGASELSALLCCENTDKELWREKEDDYYSPSIHVTKDGRIGINVGGFVHVKSARDWHKLAT